jgi:hypothetical protein
MAANGAAIWLPLALAKENAISADYGCHRRAKSFFHSWNLSPASKKQ